MNCLVHLLHDRGRQGSNHTEAYDLPTVSPYRARQVQKRHSSFFQSCALKSDFKTHSQNPKSSKDRSCLMRYQLHVSRNRAVTMRLLYIKTIRFVL